MAHNDPFLRVKARGIFFWLILAIPLLVFLSELMQFGVKLWQQTNNSTIRAEDPLFVTLVGNTFIYLIVIVWLFYHQKRSRLRLEFIFGQLPPFRQCLYWLLLVIPILMFSLGSGQIIYYVVSLSDPQLVTSLIGERLFLTAQQTNYPVIYNTVQFISIVILAPLLEEILFRGIILQRWSVKWSILSGIFFSSLVFGCLHFNFLGLFNFGLVMALLYLRTQNLFLPIMVHGLNNLIAVGLEVWATVLKNGEAFYTVEQLQSSWWQGLVAMILALPWLILFWRNNWQLARHTLPYFANRDRLVMKTVPE